MIVIQRIINAQRNLLCQSIPVRSVRPRGRSGIRQNRTGCLPRRPCNCPDPSLDPLQRRNKSFTVLSVMLSPLSRPLRTPAYFCRQLLNFCRRLLMWSLLSYLCCIQTCPHLSPQLISIYMIFRLNNHKSDLQSSITYFIPVEIYLKMCSDIYVALLGDRIQKEASHQQSSTEIQQLSIEICGGAEGLLLSYCPAAEESRQNKVQTQQTCGWYSSKWRWFFLLRRSWQP